MFNDLGKTHPPLNCHLVNAFPIHLKIFAEWNSIFNGFPRLYPSRPGGVRASISLLLHRYIPWNRTVVPINHRDLIIPPDYALCHNHMPSSVVDQIDANDNRLVLSPFCFGHADLQLKLLGSGFEGSLSLGLWRCPLLRTTTTDERQYAK